MVDLLTPNTLPVDLPDIDQPPDDSDQLPDDNDSKPAASSSTVSEDISIYSVVRDAMNDNEFVREFSKLKKHPPLPVLAVASHLSNNKHNIRDWIPMHNTKYCIPIRKAKGERLNPHYHSIEGSSILYVHWELHFPDIKLPCTRPIGRAGLMCEGRLKATRTNWSKNKKLFPLFRSKGRPSWCIIMTYQCDKCKQYVRGNDGKLLIMLPEYIRNAYPVEPKFV